MTISIAMTMRLLSSMMVTKNGRPRRQKLRKDFCLLRGIHQDGGIGVFLKTRKTDRKIVEVVVFDHLIC